MHARDRETVRGMSRVIQSSVRAGDRTTTLAEKLLSTDKPSVHLTRYVREMGEAARFPRGPGDANVFEDVVRRWTRQVERLGQGAAGTAGDYTIRSATRQLVTDLRRAKPAQVDRIVNRWVLEKARYQARVIARHESVEAFRDQQVAGLKKQAWNKGIRWTLSGSHPRKDVCDVLASQDLYGLGAGGYPLDSIPARHVSDLCLFVSIADPHYLAREKAKLTGAEEPPKPWLSGRKQTGDEWLMSQPLETQKAILGPTRLKLLGRERVMTLDNSSLRKVHNLLGKKAPLRDMGPKIEATKIVAADRASVARTL